MKHKLSNYPLQKLYIKIFVLIWILVLCFSGVVSLNIQTMLGLITALSGLSYLIYKKTNLLLGISFAYFTISQVPLITDPTSYFSQFGSTGVISFQTVISQGLLSLILLSLFVLHFYNKLNFKNAFLTFALVDSLVMIAKFFTGLPPYFLFNNPAIDASFIACCLPMTFSNRKTSMFMTATLLGGAIVTLTSSSIIGIFLATTLYFASEYKFKLKKLLLFIPYGLLLAALGFITQGNILWNSSGRTAIWNMAMNYWTNEANLYVGTGTNTFQIYGPSLQIIEAMQKNIDQVNTFFWMHNDWLQILFENGIIGLILALLILARGAWHARLSPMLFSSLLTFAALAVIQMPLRHTLFASLGAWLIINTHKLEKKTCAPTNNQ